MEPIYLFEKDNVQICAEFKIQEKQLFVFLQFFVLHDYVRYIFCAKLDEKISSKIGVFLQAILILLTFID